MLKKSITLNLYKKLVGFLTKKGHQIKAKKIINKIFFLLSKLTKAKFSFLVYFLFERLKIFVEARSLRIRRRTYVVPFILTYERQIYFAAKFLFKAIKRNKTKCSIIDKFIKEILLVYKASKTSMAYCLAKINDRLLLKNRSNSHFRW